MSIDSVAMIIAVHYYSCYNRQVKSYTFSAFNIKNKWAFGKRVLLGNYAIIQLLYSINKLVTQQI